MCGLFKWNTLKATYALQNIKDNNIAYIISRLLHYASGIECRIALRSITHAWFTRVRGEKLTNSSNHADLPRSASLFGNIISRPDH